MNVESSSERQEAAFVASRGEESKQVVFNPVPVPVQVLDGGKVGIKSPLCRPDGSVRSGPVVSGC